MLLVKKSSLNVIESNKCQSTINISFLDKAVEQLGLLDNLKKAAYSNLFLFVLRLCLT